jgi:iron-sulfur cluster assembly accessory protein
MSSLATDTASAGIPAVERISMTERASAHIRKELAKQPGAIGLRIAVKTTGCSGLMYVVDFVSEKNDDDLVFDITEDLAVFVDPKSFECIRGTEIDFVQEGLSRHLAFNNPNAVSQCGCGESFSVS